jgi:hypothetical protein
MLARVLTTLILVFGANNFAKAQVLGADIFASEIGNDTATIQANVYLFCNSYFTVNDTLTVDALINFKDTVRVLLKPRITDIDTVYTNCNYCGCPDTFCSFPFIIRRKLVYDFVPNNFGFQNVCEISAKLAPGKRYGGNFFIGGADTTIMTVFCDLNLCQSNRLHKYNFNLAPSFYALNGKSYLHAQGFAQAFDSISPKSEIDSISAVLANPIRKNGNRLQYKKGYDYLNPLHYNGYPNTSNSFPRGFHLIEETGDLRFTPSQKGDALIKTQFKVYGDSGLLQVATREYVLLILDKKKVSPPYLSGKNNSSFLNANNYKLYTCWNQKRSSVFIAKDLDNAGIGQIYVDIPKAFKPHIEHKIKGDSILFEYDFDSIDLSNRPLKITIQVKDTFCNSGSESSFSIQFHNNYTPVISPSISLKKQRTFQLSGIVDTSFLAKSYQWKINGMQFNKLDTTFELKTPGEYKYQLISYGNGACNDTIRSRFKAPQFPYIEINSIAQNVCQYDSITLNSSYFYSSQPPEYSWNGQKLSSAFDVVISTDTTIILSALFGDSTVNADTIHLKALPNPFPDIIAPPFHCKGNTLELKAALDSSLIDTSNTTIWQVDSSRFINQKSVNIQGEKRVSLVTNYRNGCINSVSKYFDFNVNYLNGLESLETCPQKSLNIKAFTENGYKHVLFINDTIFGQANNEFNYPRAKRNDTLILETQFDSANANCLFIDTLNIDFLPLVKFEVTGDTVFCVNDGPVHIHDTSFVNPPNGTWLPPVGKLNAIGKDSFIPNILAPLDTQYLVNYTVTNPENGCRFSRDIRFSVKPVFAPQFVADSIKLCIGGNNILLNNIDYAIPSNGSWQGSGVIDSIDKQYFSPSLVGINSTNTLNYFYTGSNGCTSKNDVTVTVNLKPNPVAETVRSGIAPISIQFLDLRDTSDCQVDEWFWDFYDNFGEPCTLDVKVDSLAELYCRYSTSPTPIHRYRKSGIYPVKLVVRDSKTGVKDSIIKFNYIFLIGSSIDNYEYGQISIYPNPTSNRKIIVEQEEFDFLKYEVYSTTGQLLKKGTTRGPKGTIDFESHHGLLMISVFNQDKTFTYTQRVLVK